MFGWGIKSFLVSGGEEIAIDPASTLIILGPNSSGKTTALRELEVRLYPRTDVQYWSPRVVQNVVPFREGTEKEFSDWLKEHYSYNLRGRTALAAREAIISQEQVRSLWDGLLGGSTIENASRFVCERLDAGTRLDIGKSKKSFYAYHNPPYEYIHILQLRDDLLSQISADVRGAFGVDLIINWSGGPDVWFHVGDEPQRGVGRDRVSPEYLKDLNELPHLEQAGDGIRSFVGALLATRCGAHPVLLIDEPEAFLHPPQIRRLAGILARSAERLNRQVIIATHSSEVIRGALASSDRVEICRLTRSGNSNHASLLQRSSIKELWAKPLLRSAAAIDGVFYQGVIVSEADSDSRFYEAIVQRLESTQRLAAPMDLYFIHGGGKGELSTLAKAYMSLRVPVAVIADLDLLRNKVEFVKVLNSLGGNFDQIESCYNTTVSALNNLPPIKSVTEFMREVQEFLSRVQQQGFVSSTDRRLLTELIKDSGDWSEAKKYGVRKLRGGAFVACEELLKACKAVGLFLVPCGELESWEIGGSANKLEWFLTAIDTLHSNPASFSEASEFMLEVCQYLST